MGWLPVMLMSCYIWWIYTLVDPTTEISGSGRSGVLIKV